MASNPVPLRFTFVGLPAALCVIVNAPLRAATAVGVNVTLMAQFTPGLSEPPHVFVCAKSPVVLMLLSVSVAAPTLLIVTLCAALVVPMRCPAKTRLIVDTMSAEVVPVPASVIVCGLPLALSEMESVPSHAPAVLGVNVTLIAHALDAASDAPQLFVCAKPPLAEMLFSVSDALPVFVTVTVCAMLVVPTC